MNSQEALPVEPACDDAEATDELTVDDWMRQVVARHDTTVGGIARAMQADGMGEAEAHVLAAVGILRHDTALLSAVLEKSRLQDAMWALLRHFREARIAELVARESLAQPSPVRPLSPRDLGRNTVLHDGRLIYVRATCCSPDLALFDNVLSPQECDALIDLSRDRMSASQVMGTDEALVDTAVRSSTGCFLADDGPALLNRLKVRIGELTRWPTSHHEGLAVTRYLPGQEFKPHWDFFDTDVGMSSHRKAIAQSGQRIGTVFLYLSDVPSGGGTLFDFAGLQVRPRKGSALYFAYQLPDGSPDVASLHCGATVGEGEKWIATVWLCERPVPHVPAQFAPA